MNVSTLPRAAALACAAILFCSVPAPAQVPDEVLDLAWCPGSRECLLWTPVTAADGYTLYRGDLVGVQGIVTNEADPCVAGTFADTTSGPGLAAPPPPTGHWYLVAATNGAGEGSAGDATAGPRLVATTATCDGGTGGGLVLNEIDYDQSGADTAEFVEIVNAGATAVDLTNVAVILVNGSNASEYGRLDLAAAGSLDPGGFVVVGAASVLAGLPAGVVGLPLPASLQNGAPDGLALFDTATGTLLDALSYEGEIRAAAFDGVGGTFDLVEGVAAAAADTGEGALARFPDGRDTDDADADWSLAPLPTPGTANVEG